MVMLNKSISNLPAAPKTQWWKQKTNAALLGVAVFMSACLPPAEPYPTQNPASIVAQAQQLSDSLESYIMRWTQNQVGDSIPDSLIPDGITDSRDFYLKDPALATDAETWAIRYAKPIDKDSLYSGIPDPKITYLFLGTALAPFGSKLVIEGQYPHCRFFSIQISPPLNGEEYYAQRQFGTAEVSIVDADIEPNPGSVNPFRVGANRNAPNRDYKMEFELTTGNPTALNDSAHDYPYRKNVNTRKGALMVCQGPLGFETIANTPLPLNKQGMWDLGCVWIRYYEPDSAVGPLGGVPLPKVYFELPNGSRYFIGSNFTELVNRANTTSPNRVTTGYMNPNFGPKVGWYKSWGIVRSIFNGIAQSNGWSRVDSSAHIRALDLGYTGRSEFRPAPANIEPHATTNNYCTYMGRDVGIPEGMVAVLTGKLPTFPQTYQGQTTMTAGDVRYWSIVGIDTDPFSPLPATTIHAIADDEVVLDNQRNYVIAYSRTTDRPTNATAGNGVSWVDWGTQTNVGLLMRWVNVGPEWRFSLAPQEHNLSFLRSDWGSPQYDSTLIGVNWRNGFMQCYLPQVHYMTKAEFEALGNNLTAEVIPTWVDSSYTLAGAAESIRGLAGASSALTNNAADQAFNANDGNVATFWSSAWGMPNQIIAIDLGAVKKISAVKLNWDWIFFGKDYTVEVSNDSINWTVIATVTNENGQIDLYRNLMNISGRYVRLNLTAYNAGYYRLAEFEVYTTDCSCSAPPTGMSESQLMRSRIQLFPNPANDFLQFNLVGIPNEEVYQTRIYSLEGKLLLDQAQQQQTGRIDVSSLNSGVYLFVAEGQSWRRSLKFMKAN